MSPILFSLIAPILRTLLVWLGAGSIAATLVTEHNLSALMTSLPVIIGAVSLLASVIWSVYKNVKTGISSSGSLWRWLIQAISSGSIVAVLFSGLDMTSIVSAITTISGAIASILAIVSQVKANVKTNTTPITPVTPK